MNKTNLIVPICVSDVPIICRYNNYGSISKIFFKTYKKILYESNKANTNEASLSEEGDSDSYSITNAIDLLLRDTPNEISNDELLDRLCFAKDDISSQVYHANHANHANLNREIGIKYEQLAIDFYERISGKRITFRNEALHTRAVNLGDITLCISGRVDGIQEDGVIVEVKNRIFQLKEHPPVYDLAQIETYMFLLRCTQAVLIQQHIDNADVSYRFTKIMHNSIFWEREILADLICFSRAMGKFMKDKRIRDEFFKYNDHSWRERIIFNLMFATKTQRYC